ncbi:MAG: DUF5606 domain-containing protein [Schleiferiaceae bacterium]|jgi:hypothetical protein|nr:DUF5606 domain-containing protein [Schleiferiaceae bacterium]
MDLTKILAIGGKPGLYELVAQSKNGIIVQALADKKRFPVNATQNVSALNDIAIYTFEGELPLREIFRNIYKKEDGKAGLSHRESSNSIYSYFSDIAPDFDDERVYVSDMKKVLQWYNILQGHGLVDLELSEEEKEAEKEEEAAEENADA